MVTEDFPAVGALSTNMVFSLEYIISLNVCCAFNEVGKTDAVNAAIISFWIFILIIKLVVVIIKPKRSLGKKSESSLNFYFSMFLIII